jgi:phosphate transport system permease protein
MDMWVEYKVDPATLNVNGIPLEQLSNDELIRILSDNLTPNRYKTLDKAQPIAERSTAELLTLVYQEVVEPTVVNTWSLSESLFNTAQVQAEQAENYPTAYLFLKPWINLNFISSPQSSDALSAGIRTAILGSLWIIAITFLFAFPIGLGAAVYLEEYASDKTQPLYQTNNNLAGVPSIIYGMLGRTKSLCVPAFDHIGFDLRYYGSHKRQRAYDPIRLTLALLILPVIIINTQGHPRAEFSEKPAVVWGNKVANDLASCLPNSLARFHRTISISCMGDSL